MATPSQQPNAGSERNSGVPNLISILSKQKLLSKEQVEKFNRARKLQPGSDEDVLQRLGLLSDVEIAQAVASYTNLPFLKINPMDLTWT